MQQQETNLNYSPLSFREVIEVYPERNGHKALTRFVGLVL